MHCDKAKTAGGCHSSEEWFCLFMVVMFQIEYDCDLLTLKTTVWKSHPIWADEARREDGRARGEEGRQRSCVTCWALSSGEKVFLGELMEKQPWAMTLSWLGIQHHRSHGENDPFKHSVTGSHQIKMQETGVWVHTCANSSAHTLLTTGEENRPLLPSSKVYSICFLPISPEK